MRIKLMNLGALLLMLALVNWFVAPEVRAGETEKYHGMILDEGNPPGYDPGSGACISTDPIGPNNCLFGLSWSAEVFVNGNMLEVLWLKSDTGNRDERGDIIWRVEDTLEYPANDNSEIFFEWESCSSPAFPKGMIIARGQWHWRKRPGVGGYLRPIEKAWRIDLALRKFVEIATNGVVCEVNEDRD